jgi:disulfide bond formation protein DsbB
MAAATPPGTAPEGEMALERSKAALLIGLSWPCIGLGFMALHFGYIPSWPALPAYAIGLFLAGAWSGLLFAVVQASLQSEPSKRLVQLGYVLFAPLGLLLSLLVPDLLLASNSASASLPLMTVMPAVIGLLGSLAVAVGLMFTAALAVAAHGLALRIQGGVSQSFAV